MLLSHLVQQHRGNACLNANSHSKQKTGKLSRLVVTGKGEGMLTAKLSDTRKSERKLTRRKQFVQVPQIP